MTTLPPGFYLIELEFERPVNYGTLCAALEKMGFMRLTPDDTAADTIGAVATLGKRRATPAAATHSSLSAARARTPVATAAVARVVAKPPAASVIAKPKPAPTPVTPSLGKRRATPGSQVSAAAIAAARAKASASVATVHAKPSLGKTHKSAPMPDPATPGKPVASLGKRKASPAGGGDAGGGASTESPELPDDEAYAAPEDENASAQAPAPTAGSVADLWRRWVEWGSPFATGPAKVSGEEEPLFRFRFIAQLANPLRVENTEGKRWLYVRRLNMNPFGDLDFNFEPFRVERGKRYELRFLARTKAMPSRDDVKQGLASMGFSPMKLSVMHRHMRVPSRAGNSVSMWYGIATWERGEATVTVNDPFFFLNVQEIPR
jgi:hypothetical protein